MDDGKISVQDLLDPLAESVRCAELATDNLRFDYSNEQQRVCVGLLQAVIEYAKALHLVSGHGVCYPTATLLRSALDALVDITNACKDPAYGENLALRDAHAWHQLLQRASWQKNPLFAAITESDALAPGRRVYKEKVKELESKAVEVLEPQERFELADMGDVYEAAYCPLSAEAPNNISFVTSHFFDVRSDRLRDRGTLPRNGAPRTATAIMSDIVIRATELVLHLCGHGSAMLSPARARLDAIRERFDRHVRQGASSRGN